MTGAASGSSGAGYWSMTGLEETTLMPAARNRSRSARASKMRSSAMAVWTMQSGCRASSASTSFDPGHAHGVAQSGQVAGVAPDLVRVGDEEPDQLELGMGVDAGEGMAPHVAGAPLHDAIRHGLLLGA